MSREVSLLTVKLNEKLSKIKTPFKLRTGKNIKEICILSFDDEFITTTELLGNISDGERDLLQGLNGNLSYVKYVDKRNDLIIIAVEPVFEIKKFENSIHLKFEGDEKTDVYLKDSYKYLFAYININDLKFESFYISDLDKKIFLQIKLNSIDGGDRYFSVEKIQKRINNMQNYQKHLIIGDFLLSKQVEPLNIEVSLALKSIQGNITNYLNLWDKYNFIEHQLQFDALKKNGCIRYVKSNAISDETKIILAFDKDEFKKIEKMAGEMLYIGTVEIKGLTYAKDIDEYKKIEKLLLENKEMTTCYFVKNDINKVEKTVPIHLKNSNNFNIPRTGFICCSLLGQTISYNRRNKVRDRILKGNAGIPNMVTWFSENPVPGKKEEEQNIDFTLLKHKNLTANQLEALKIIINTPDIAIIQGPPGTGKTTIISESLTQINNISKRNHNFANNLLSGFKHETVLNMTDSISLYELPTIKVGSKKDEEDDKLVEKNVIDYINTLVDKIDEKYGDISYRDYEFEKFQKLYLNFKNFRNSVVSAVEILNQIESLEMFKYNKKVFENIESFKEKLNATNKESDDIDLEFIDFLYSLPTCQSQFEDDKDRIEASLCVFDYIEKFSKAINNIRNVISEEPIDFNKLKYLRKKLIVKYRKIPELFITNGIRIEILKYLETLSEEVRINKLKQFDGKELAILNYRDSLLENPAIIKDTILEYSRVLGSTNQQSISKAMADIDTKVSDIKFDNVYIDEAATSAPPDLFIPMSTARRRIILVGDHKQLPNIIDDEIISKIEKEIGIDVAEDKNVRRQIKTTLFEHLIETAKRLELIDGRKRVITLDTQFRMNPKLGKIIGDHFYVEEGGLKSIRPESDFAHNYHGLTNKYLYWIDTPFNNLSKYKTTNRSRINEDEANKIAKHIVEAINSETYKGETIGVISFYRDQVDEIKKALQNEGVFDEKFNLIGKYIGVEILVGTVDAFQGREFDIVYLSVTYTFDLENIEKEKYSRLTVSNLLNVALSRQKRMLIVVGNSKIFGVEKAKSLVPSLFDINNICKEENNYE